MNEQAIKELYWELHTRAKKINAKLNGIEGNAKKEVTQKLRELSQMLTQLSEKATEKGINIKDKTGINVIDNASDDWLQFLTISSLPKTVKSVLKTKIESLGTIPTANQMNKLLQFCEKYYTQNITKLKKERAIKSFEKNKGTYTNQDVDRIVADYKKAAKVALTESIKKLDTAFKLQMEEVQPIFDSYHSGEQVMEGDENNHWKTQIETSDLLLEIKQALGNKISTLAVEPTPKQIRTLLKAMDKYYQANVGQVDEQQLIKTYEQHQGRYTDQALEGIAEKHKKAAISAIMKQIDQLDTTFSFDENAAHDTFVAIYKGKSLLDTVTDSIESVPHQFKIDIATKKLDLAKEKYGFSFKNPSIQISMKGGYLKAAHLSRKTNEDISFLFVEAYEQHLRSTVTVGTIADIIKGKFNPKMSSNAFSNGIQVDLPGGIGNMVVKCDWINMTWVDFEIGKGETKLNKLIEPSLGAFRIQVNLNMLTFSQYMGIGIPGIELKRGIVTLAIGCNIGLTKDFYTDFVSKKAKEYAEKKAEQKAQKKIVEQVIKSMSEIHEHADDLKGILEDISNKKKLSKEQIELAKKLGSKGEIIEEILKNVDNVAKEAIEKSVKEGAEKLGTAAAKMAAKKAAIIVAGKMMLRLVPIVGQVMTFIDIATITWQVVKWWISESDSESTKNVVPSSTDTNVHRPHPGKI